MKRLCLILLVCCERKVQVTITVDAAPPSSSASSVPSAAPVVDAGARDPNKLSFNDEQAGSPPKSFEAVVGDWYIGEDPKTKNLGLWVDGTKWRQGTPSANIADQAKRLYGDKSAEFLDGVKAFAFFPLAVLPSPTLAAGRIQVRFYPESGKIDQGAGIAFGIHEDGSYFGVRANALEDNMLVFKVVRGQRTILQTIRGITTTTHEWHTLMVDFENKTISAWLDGSQKVDHARIEGDFRGRVGLWSKADSKVLFDDYEIQPR